MLINKGLSCQSVQKCSLNSAVLLIYFAEPGGMFGQLVLLENKSKQLEVVNLPTPVGSKHSFQELKV